jgi:arylsulfatase A-like enzyme
MPITRRAFAQSLAAAATAPAQTRLRRRPNVVLILAGDLAYGDLSLHGNPHLRTGALDLLASQGAEFVRFYSDPGDAGTRASLLTGRYSLRANIHGEAGGRETLPLAETTIAEALHLSGYRTALFGAWHLGMHYPYVPQGQGFDEFAGYRAGQPLDNWDPQLEHNGRPFPVYGYLAEVLTSEALRFLDERHDPFFLWLSYNLPHTPYQAPERYWERFRKLDLPDTVRAAYAQIACLDDCVARVLARVDNLGIAENTIVVFLAGNGPAVPRFNAGLRGTKGSMYEGGTRVPCCIRWSGHIEPGRRIESIAAPVDLYPTLLELCHAPQPEAAFRIDGLNLMPLLTGEEPHWDDRQLFVRAAPPGDPSALYPSAIRNQRFNLVNGIELYEIANDPGEQTDVTKRFPAQAAELRRVYHAWVRSALPAAGFRTPPVPAGHVQEDPVRLTPAEGHPLGAVRYQNGDGSAHDWFAGWDAAASSAYWDISVVSAGRFAVSVRYLCPPAAVGTRVEVRAGTAAVSAPIATAAPLDPVAARDLVPRRESGPRQWQTLALGTLDLGKGTQRIELRAAPEGAAGLQTNEVSLRRAVAAAATG